MGNEVFLSSVKRLTDGNLTTSELLGAAATLQAAGESDLVAQLYKLWIQLNPQDPLLYALHFNLAVTLSNTGQYAEAAQNLERAIALNADFYPSYINLGGLLERNGAAGQAIAKWSEMTGRLGAVTGASVNYKVTALKQIARVMESNQLFTQAEEMLKQSLDINPQQPDVIQHFVADRLAQCEWPIISPWEGMSHKALMKGVGPLSMAVYTDDPILQLASGWSYAKTFIGYPANDFREKHKTANTDRSAKRRIGYLSSDLRHHAVGFIMAEVFGLHNRDEFEIFVYYCGIPQEDPMKARIRNSVEHWLDINDMDDETAAKRIIADGIDILIDVNGFTKDARTKMLSLHPAPVIVNWLGFPGSMGTPYHHYIIADEYIIPRGQEKYYSEKVVRLPCYQPNDRQRAPSPETPTRAQMGLPEDATVFCCFNGAQKISRFTFDRWIAILKRVPGSVLWLLDGAEGTRKRLTDYAVQHGIATGRLIFAGKLTNPHHLARYPLADLFLDTSPYGAHVTASDALWMGVPILTFSGRGFAARVCGSLLTAAGMEELICANPEEYVEKAVALGQDKAAIAKLKKKLAANRDSCTLFDTKSTVQHLEKLYTQMWREYQQGQLPIPDLSNLDLYLELGGEFEHETTEMLTVEDYEGAYRAKLARLHAYSPVRNDSRLWTAEDSATSDAPASQSRLSKNPPSEARPKKTAGSRKELINE